jgi:phosphoenolpyruvate---glycerone phosphotransferase subunit DhaL
MTPNPSWTAGEFRLRLVDAGDNVIANKEELTLLDAAAGDGDLGVTMARGFAAVRDSLLADPPVTVDEQLRRVGTVLLTEAPSTMGTLLGGSLTTIAERFGGLDEIGAADLAAILEALAAAIAELGGASLGQRTALDALYPAAEAAAAGRDVHEAIAAAVGAAEQGARDTEAMAPAIGRARWTGERARGVRDGGAQVIALWLAGLAGDKSPTN